ncbi:MAG: hypothetical protein Tsb005_20230 [Gammaproteobacteria bacterium]
MATPTTWITPYDGGTPQRDIRPAIIVAAKKQFYGKGYAGTDLSVIAQHANITVPKLKRYFATKLSLLRACIDDNMRQLNDAFHPLISSDLPPETLIEQFITALHHLLKPDGYHDFAHCLATELMGSHDAEKILVNYVARWQQLVMQLLTTLTRHAMHNERLLPLLLMLQGSVYYQRIYRNPNYLNVTLTYLRHVLVTAD